MSWIIWFIVTVVLVITEIITTSLFFFFCLAFGALSAGVLSALGSGIWGQVLVFALVSGVSVMFIRPTLKKYLKTTDSKGSNVDEMIGKDAVVIKTVGAETPGFVKIFGEVWSAVSDEGSMGKGETVKVVAVEGTKLIVSKK